MHNPTDLTIATPATTSALIDRAALVAALTAISRVIEARNTIPILSNVLIQPVEGGAKLTGTDLDMMLSTVLPAAWEAPGAFTVDVRALLAAVKGCTDDTVNLTRDGGLLRITGGAVASSLATLPASDFPIIASGGDDVARFTLDATQLAADLARLAPSISTEETRYYLNGVFFHAVHEGGDDTPVVLRMATTDGHRLARITRPMPTVEGEALRDSIMPRKMIGELLKLLGKKPAGDVAFAVSASKVAIQLGGWSILSKLIDGTYPDYSRVIPSRNSVESMMNAGELGVAVGAMVKGMGRNPAVRFNISAEGAKLSVTCPENGSKAAGVAASYVDTNESVVDRHDELTIGFNAGYLAAMAGIFGADDMRINFADGCTPALFTAATAPELLALLMPMRVGDETQGKAQPVEHVEPVESPYDAFRRTYYDGLLANDGTALAQAVATYRASGVHGADDRATVAYICADIRYTNADSLTLTKRMQGRVATAYHRARKRQRAYIYGGQGRGSFDHLSRVERQMAADVEMVAVTEKWIAELPGYLADDPRALLPIATQDGKRRFVMASDIADTAQAYYLPLYKANGDRPYSRRNGFARIGRGDIARVIQPTERKAKALASEPSADVAALVATVSALTERVEALAATVEAQAVELARKPRVIRPARPPRTAAHLRAIRAYLAARKARGVVAALKREAVELNDGMFRLRRDRIAAQDERDRALVLAGTMHETRRRTAARIVAYRKRQVQPGLVAAMAKDLEAARGEIARLQPVAAAIAAMTAAAAIPPGGNVSTLRAAA